MSINKIKGVVLNSIGNPKKVNSTLVRMTTINYNINLEKSV